MFKPTFVWEQLKERENIHFSVETIRKIMINMGLWKSSPRKQDSTFQLRERKGSYGVMTQFDGSYHEWLPDVLP
jgi:hypothetical protein